MPNVLFEQIAAQVAAGAITAEQILQNACSALSAPERQALLIALAQKEVRDGTPLQLANVMSGILAGGSPALVIPAFLAGSVEFVDTDASATPSFSGTHQSATDSLGDSFPEGTRMEWPSLDGSYYVTRSITVPSGMLALYTFILK
jgi:hypothetical protein